MSGEEPTPVKRFARVLALLLAVRTLARTLAGREPPPPPAPESEYDPSQRTVPANRQAETVVAALLLVAALLGCGFVAIYVALQTNTQLLGLALGGMLVMLAAAAIIAGKLVVPQETQVEERGELLVEDEAEEVVETIEAGVEGISRRKLLAGAGGAAGAAAIAAAATPLASLGPRLRGIHDTPWHHGVRLVDEQGNPYPAGEIQVGTFYTALPEAGGSETFGAGVLLVRLLPDQIHLPAPRRAWAPEGIMAFSKICPHAGCAISLYRYPTYEQTSLSPAFTCPCHYSTFLPGDGGRVVFGPAGRPLPQLPLMIDDLGHVRAAGAFPEDIGPSWWDVHRGQS
ncbi:MAG TPA: Rieske (2Fe-2S) protein [Solirubrobacteraceae bacterium]